MVREIYCTDFVPKEKSYFQRASFAWMQFINAEIATFLADVHYIFLKKMQKKPQRK